MEKQCFKCRETKNISEFYRHPAMGDGFLGKCKTCAKRDVAERAGRLSNNPMWLAKERDRCRKKQARYRALGLAQPTTTATREKWAMNNPHKISAERKANGAVRSKKIPKPLNCSRCNATGVRLEKHHPDYSKPLEIQWLCSPCHGLTRRKEYDPDDVIP